MCDARCGPALRSRWAALSLCMLPWHLLKAQCKCSCNFPLVLQRSVSFGSGGAAAQGLVDVRGAGQEGSAAV